MPDLQAMPVTPSFIANWFLASALTFGLFMGLFRFSTDEQPDRDLNTFLIILSQGIGAALAYAVH